MPIASSGFLSKVTRDLRVLYHLVFTGADGATHSERIEHFYRGQAADYDAFREKLLSARPLLYKQLEIPQDGVWVEMGGGTGANLENLGEQIHRLRKIYIVDLSPSLLQIAHRRIRERGWKQIEIVEADALTFTPAEKQVDVVTFSFSLTMIPDWFAAIDHARRILKPGGQVGVVDFFVSRKHPVAGIDPHSWLARTLWPLWFARDSVFLNPDHLPYLQSSFTTHYLNCGKSRLPYLPGCKVPHYVFVGNKSGADLPDGSIKSHRFP